MTSLALNHHTSKLTSLSSLTTLTSFGFRGEALSSLCALCDSVVIATATDADGQKGVGMKLEMGRRGDVVKKSVIARQVGSHFLLFILDVFHPSCPIGKHKQLILSKYAAWYNNVPNQSVRPPPRPAERIRAQCQTGIRQGNGSADWVCSGPVRQ